LSQLLRPAIRSNRPGLLQKGVVLQHDNAPLRDRPVRQLRKLNRWAGTELLQHLLYSPDLAPSDFSFVRTTQRIYLETLCSRTLNMFNSMHAEIFTRCQQKLNVTGSSRLAEQWEHCSELQRNFVKSNITARIVRFTVIV